MVGYEQDNSRLAHFLATALSWVSFGIAVAVDKKRFRIVGVYTLKPGQDVKTNADGVEAAASDDSLSAVVPHNARADLHFIQIESGKTFVHNVGDTGMRFDSDRWEVIPGFAQVIDEKGNPYTINERNSQKPLHANGIVYVYLPQQTPMTK